MRSIAAATLLTACGFCAPLDAGSRMRRFDHIFVRGASSDVPVERKSAFGAEMGDIAALFRCCGENSLVFVDELGRGTSPEDGTRLSAAILESMAQSGMSGIFATHLHGILSFTNLVLDRITMKRMAIDDREMQEKDNVGMWKYTLEDGICLDSMALVTAKHFGLPKSVIERANKFQVTVPSLDPKYSMVSSSNLTEKDNLDLQIALMVKDVTEKTSISIPVNWNVPASFDGCSSVYVLKISSNPSKFYVGESDNLRRRIQQHRSKGKSWYNLEAVAVVSADNKSQARTWEKNLIQKLTAFGMNVISTVDGR